MVGEGGMPSDEFMAWNDLGLAMLYIEGVYRRYRSQYEAARMVSRVSASLVVKHLPDNFLELPWDKEQQKKREQTHDEIIKEYQKAEPALMAAMQKAISRNKKNGK